jgi:hypothetical protein
MTVNYHGKKFYSIGPSMTINYCGILTLEIICFYTPIIYHGKLPWYFYNTGPCLIHQNTLQILIKMLCDVTGRKSVLREKDFRFLA